MTRWGDEDVETRSLKFQQPLSLAVQFLGAPHLLLVLKYTNFRSLPSPPLIFSENPFRVSKIFRVPPQYLHPALVILNELSLIRSFVTVCSSLKASLT